MCPVASYSDSFLILFSEIYFILISPNTSLMNLQILPFLSADFFTTPEQSYKTSTMKPFYR